MTDRASARFVVVAFAVAGALVVAVGCCSDHASHKARLAKEQAYSELMHRVDIVHGITYLEDARLTPPACFAYFWGGAGNGGPALATVPCASVPEAMLTVVR